MPRRPTLASSRPRKPSSGSPRRSTASSPRATPTLAPSDRGMAVALLGADDKVTLTPVQLGRDLGDSVEVVAGLTPTDRVIDNPPESLQTGDTVQLAAAPAAPH